MKNNIDWSPTGINEQIHANLSMKDSTCTPLAQPTKRRQPAQRFAVAANALLSTANIKTKSLKNWTNIRFGSYKSFPGEKCASDSTSTH